jgi:hypothetical protein
MTDLTKLAQLAEQHALSYASPHHFTLSVTGLRSIIEAAFPTQPRPQPLTTEQIDAVYREVWSTVTHTKRLSAFARAIEAKHGITAQDPTK